MLVEPGRVFWHARSQLVSLKPPESPDGAS